MTYKPHPILENGQCAVCGFGPSERNMLGCAGPKPLLIGMNNPVSSDPEFALYPRPEGHAGHRLWKVLNEVSGITQSQYLRRFRRTNVLPGKQWNRAAAKVAALELRATFLAPVVLLVGAETRSVFDMNCNYGLLTDPVQWGFGKTRWTWIPHPSGRNAYYNDPENRRRVGLILQAIYNGEDPVLC